MTQEKRIAIIGAGASGLPAIKCVQEEGMIPVCFERTDDIGGLWNYKPNVRADGQSSIMKTTVINTSKEKMCYSDFPIPEDFPNFMHNTKVQEYFRLYAKEFDLLKAIKFNTEVKKVSKSKDFEQDGRWEIEIIDVLTKQKSMEIFDGVLICTGHHAEMNRPSFEGDDRFKGSQVHTHDYKDHKGYEDKKVVVIGIGNSGGDVAVELARCSKQVYLSTRRGAWIMFRIGNYGLPVDLQFDRRWTQDLVNKWFPTWLTDTMGESLVNKRFDHTAYGLKPKHRLTAQHPTVNDELPNRIACGSIIVKPNVKCFHENSVEFEDGTLEQDVDAVVYATGYKFGFPFVDEDVLKVKNNRIRLYKYMFPPQLKHGTLAIIGCFQPLGAVMPLSEMQCRWAARVFKGTTSLPRHGKMWEDIIAKEDDMRERYVESQRHTIQVDWIKFMDEIAEHVGCKPNFKELVLTDPRLAYECYFGPSTPYQYRLSGPGAWSDAREAILTQWDRVMRPLQTRGNIQRDKNIGWMKIIMTAVILYFVYSLFF